MTPELFPEISVKSSEIELHIELIPSIVICTAVHVINELHSWELFHVQPYLDRILIDGYICFLYVTKYSLMGQLEWSVIKKLLQSK